MESKKTLSGQSEAVETTVTSRTSLSTAVSPDCSGSIWESCSVSPKISPPCLLVPGAGESSEMSWELGCPVLLGERCGRGASVGSGVTPWTPIPSRLPATWVSCWREEEEEDISVFWCSNGVG